MSEHLATEERGLWLSVIYQGLDDATIGLCKQKDKKPLTHKPGAIRPFEIYDARAFIKGQTTSLKDICDAIGRDYEEMRDALCAPYFPPAFADPDYPLSEAA